MILANADLRQLRIFVAVAECGGLSAAEARLAVGRSTISLALSDLETRIGARLCRRGRGGFALTEDGVRVLDGARRLLRTCDAFWGEVRGGGRRLSGRLAVAVMDGTATDAACPLAGSIAALRDRADDVLVDVAVASPVEVELAVLNGRAEIGLAITRHPLAGLVYDPCYAETACLHVGRGHPLFDADPAALGPDALATADYVRRGHVRGGDLEGPGRPAATSDHEEGILHLVLTGRYVGYLPVHHAAPWVAAGRLRALGIPGSRQVRDVYAIRRNGSPLSPVARAFHALLLATGPDAAAGSARPGPATGGV